MQNKGMREALIMRDEGGLQINIGINRDDESALFTDRYSDRTRAIFVEKSNFWRKK